MAGVTLVVRLRERRVGLPAILVTGRITEELRRRAAGAVLRSWGRASRMQIEPAMSARHRAEAEPADCDCR